MKTGAYALISLITFSDIKRILEKHRGCVSELVTILSKHALKIV